MQIELQQVGKRYNKEWIFRGVNFLFPENSKSALLGNNGSGKSTLLQIISGHLLCSEGKVFYRNDNQEIEVDKAYKYLGYTAPAMQLPELMRVEEFLNYHLQFKNSAFTTTQILEYLGMYDARNKLLEECSSGMKQRIRLAQAIMTDVPLVLLDEPTSNLDADGIALYHKMIEEFTTNKTVIISSNDPQEYSFCTQQLMVQDFKN